MCALEQAETPQQPAKRRPSTKKVAAIGAGSVVLVAFLALLSWGLVSKAPVTGLSGITRVEKPAPEFAMPTFDGGTFRLSDHLGKPIVINFWASWCPPCRDEALVLEEAWRGYAPQGVVFVGVDIQDVEDDAAAYLREFGITYPNGRDVDGKITVDYGVIGLPVTFFISKDGTVVRRWVGAVRPAELRAWVDGLISGQVPEGETLGENPDKFFRLGQDNLEQEPQE
jgi:cytochrome c biogenesis protein CcmG/thiol:disulfide interchange protein DsbE